MTAFRTKNHIPFSCRGMVIFSLIVSIGLITGTDCQKSLSPMAPPPKPKSDVYSIMGVVRHQGGPVAGAIVRIQLTENKTATKEDGTFILTNLASEDTVVVTAWADGYYVGWKRTPPDADSVVISLSPYYTTDNPDYDWFSHEGASGSESCSHCMPSFNEWKADAHSQSAVNPRFLTMYNGNDIHGNQSPPTRYGYNRDYGRFPLPPDPTKSYYGPGYKLDFPGTAGNCAACHVPTQAAKPGMAYAADPNEAEGIDKEGVHCEFCHKIGGVKLDPSTGLPYPNVPGVLSMRLYRPEKDQQIFFGNFDDVTRRVSYLPLIEQSAFCAACHFGEFWGTVVYNSFGEWLESSYSNPKTGKTCQNCHMLPVNYNYFVYPDKGGLYRNPDRIFNHRMPGAMDEQLLKNAVTMTASTLVIKNQISVQVSIINDKTGHHVPTDSPLRHMILLVEAMDDLDNPLVQTDGPTVPDWGGVGNPKQGYYAGLPGKAFAKVLKELWTGITPTGAYWNPTRILSDNRIAAYGHDTSRYDFTAPVKGTVRISIRLIFRRAFKELMDQKGWDTPDIVMAQQTLHVNCSTSVQMARAIGD